jgi:protein phosphatase
VSEAHREIISEGNLNPAQFGMATTLVAAAVDPDCRCTVINVGDSRAYRIDGLVRHTRDHSYVQSLLDAGEITPAEAWHHPFGNIITQAIGDRDLPIVPDIYESEAKGTYLVLSSDGMHDYVPEDRIAEIIRSFGQDLRRSCNQLVAEALAGGSEDNITVIVARVGEADRGPSP